MCDNNCIAIFSKNDVQIIKQNEIIIKGRRTVNGLWKIPLANNKPSQQSIPSLSQHKRVANSIIKIRTTKGELVQYYAATLIKPTKLILLRVIHKNHFTSWPSLTTKLVKNHLKKRLASIQGHMDLYFKNLWSTTTADEMDISNFAPGQENNNQKTNEIMCTLVSTEEWYTYYSDQTGKFPITSSRGHTFFLPL